MRTSIAILFFILLITGCKSKETIPRGIIPGKKMEMIIWDMIRADEYFATTGLVNDTSLEQRTQRLNMYEQIFQLHKTTKEEFKKSLIFYKSHPSILKVMMDSLTSKQKENSFKPNTLPSVSDTFPFRKKILPKVP